MPDKNGSTEQFIGKDSVVDNMNARELAAVISAAIAAANGDGKVNFRIKSIKQL